MAMAAHSWAAEKSRIGRQIPDFSLRDYHGQKVKLSDFEDAKLVVVAFLGTDCPLVKLYAPRLEALSKQYASEGVVFLGINANRQDPPTKIGAYARKYGMSFPIMKDPDNAVADQFGAIRTPEMFVLDQDRVVRYWGRIDDQYGFSTGVGYGQPRKAKSELTDGLDELLAGKPVSVPVTEAPGCLIGRVPSVEPHGDVTYSNQIARILQNRCMECHREGEIGPFPLTNYDEVLGWGEMIREVVQEERMPPWYANPDHGVFANDTRMTEEEKKLVATWVENGQPEGDPADLPEPRQFAEGWSIPEPTHVYYMRDEPLDVPADGVVDYQHFIVDPGFKEDKWVKAVEARPDNRSVVHHIIVFIVGPDATVDSGEFGGSGPLIGFAPGMQSRVYPDGYGIKIPAGSKLMFQMHYTPVGTPQKDRSSVGFVFSDPDEVHSEIKSGVCGTVSFEIPAGVEDHVIKTDRKIRRETTIMSFMPHMHLRGKSFKYEVDYPDGTTEVLLEVPRYDFNWQLWYDLVEPKTLPKGSLLRCTAHYDNSEDNVYNPDPTIDVRYGPQTWEEMMFGWYTVVEEK
jgi:peroxiredoxin